MRDKIQDLAESCYTLNEIKENALEERGDLELVLLGKIVWIVRRYLKNASNAKRLRCELRQNAHILLCMLRFFLGSRLAF